MRRGGFMILCESVYFSWKGIFMEESPWGERILIEGEPDLAALFEKWKEIKKKKLTESKEQH